MKRNKKAEAKKAKRLRTAAADGGGKVSPVGILLYELEVASRQVLEREFSFAPDGVTRFLDETRQVFAQSRPFLGFSKRVDGLRLVSLNFGLASLEVLKRDFDFQKESLNRWLSLLTKQANENRAKSPTNVAQKKEA